MVDVSGKAISVRTAVAEARVTLPREIYEKIRSVSIKKGDVLSTVKIAGIQAAKKTCDLIPLCHNIPIDRVEIEVELLPLDGVYQARIRSFVKSRYKTGAEMEALTAASVGALTLYDMCKAVSHEMRIEVRLLRKSGGKSDFVAEKDVEND